MEEYWEKVKRKSLQVMTKERMIANSRGPVSLKRVVTLIPLILLGVGSIIGAGVFVLTGVVAKEYTGPAVILSYGFSALAAFFCALCYSEFASDVPCSGAAYNYISLVFGEFLSWMAAVGLVAEHTLGISAVAKGVSGYLCTLVGADSNSLIVTFDSTDYIVIDVVGATLVAILTLLLMYGVSESFTFNSCSTALLITLVIFTICAAAPKVDSDNWSPFFPAEYGFSNTFRGSSIVFFAYLGYDAVANVAEEAKNPERDIPIAITSAVFMTSVLYMLMAGAIVGMVPYNEIDERAPFSSAFKEVGMDWANRIVSIGALLGLATTAFASACAAYRLLMVFGRDGFLPPWLGKVHPRTQTPVNATLVGGIIATSMALLLDISTLTSFGSIEALFTYNYVCQGCIWRRYRGMGPTPTPAGEEPVKWVWLFLRNALLVTVSVFEGLAVYKKWPWWAWLITILIFIGIVLSYRKLPVLYVCQNFSLPLQPLCPCLGVMFSVHLIVTLEAAAFYRFIGWQSFAAFVYLYYGVHHTKDVEEDIGGEPVEVVEDGESREAPLVKESTT